MIVFSLFGRKVCFCFSFFAMTALLVLTDVSGYVTIGVYACVLHELGHLTAMALLDVPLREIRFCCGGIRLIGEKKLLPSGSELILLLSGPAMNLFCFASLYFLPAADVRVKLFAVISLLVGIFNLLPLDALDGGGILRILGASAHPSARRTGSAAVLLLFAGLAAAGIISGKISISVAVTAAFLLLSSAAEE